MTFIDASSKVRVPSYTPPLFNGIAFVAQSPGKNEVEQLKPLVGASGQLLREICQKAGIDFDTCARLNVVGFRPPGNDFGFFCGKKADVGGKDYTLPPIASGMYLRPDFLPELTRLKEELEELKPNLVVALGREALWALTGLSGINKYRGALIESNLVKGLKVLPTFHPAGIFRQYGNKVYLSLDLFKAKGEGKFKEIQSLSRTINIYPDSPEELYDWERRASDSKYAWDHSQLLSVDIEDRTSKGKKCIECIGFAFSPFDSLVVPFFSELRPFCNYWQTEEEELEAWDFVDHMLKSYPVLGQNFVAYDTWVLWQEMGLKTLNFAEDTMIQHHCFQPEMKKGLGVLSSIYCNVPAYKTLKPRGRKIDKRDE
jgi:uracil-DNA glycosylase